MKINTMAVVVHAQEKEAWYATGLKFIDLNEKCTAFINGLYAATILHQVHRST